MTPEISYSSEDLARARKAAYDVGQREAYEDAARIAEEHEDHAYNSANYVDFPSEYRRGYEQGSMNIAAAIMAKAREVG